MIRRFYFYPFINSTPLAQMAFSISFNIGEKSVQTYRQLHNTNWTTAFWVKIMETMGSEVTDDTVKCWPMKAQADMWLATDQQQARVLRNVQISPLVSLRAAWSAETCALWRCPAVAETQTSLWKGVQRCQLDFGHFTVTALQGLYLFPHKVCLGGMGFEIKLPNLGAKSTADLK